MVALVNICLTLVLLLNCFLDYIELEKFLKLCKDQFK